MVSAEATQVAELWRANRERHVVQHGAGVIAVTATNEQTRRQVGEREWSIFRKWAWGTVRRRGLDLDTPDGARWLAAAMDYETSGDLTNDAVRWFVKADPTTLQSRRARRMQAQLRAHLFERYLAETRAAA